MVQSAPYRYYGRKSVAEASERLRAYTTTPTSSTYLAAGEEWEGGKEVDEVLGTVLGHGGAAFGAADCWTSVDRVVASVLGPNSEEPLIQIHSVCV